MARALVFGTKGWGFESLRGRKASESPAGARDGRDSKVGASPQSGVGSASWRGDRDKLFVFFCFRVFVI